MSEIDEEMLNDFLVEGWEQIETLDQEFVHLEEDSEDVKRVEGIFRVMHTLKGGAGFLNLPKLESITHHAESLLSSVWQGELEVDQGLIDLLLETADMVKSILGSLESEMTEGTHCCEELLERLEAANSSAAKGGSEHEEVTTPEAEELEIEEAETPMREDTEFESEDNQETEASPELKEMEAFQAQLMAALDKPAVGKAEESGKVKSDSPTVEPTARQAAGKQIRVKVELLDKLMNLVGELVLSRNQLLQLAAAKENPGMEVACQRINLVTSELQDNILQARMQPIDTILKKFPRLVRDLAAQTGKEVRLTMEGEETGLDRTILEAIKDPLTHILRNSIDHGLETPSDRRALGKTDHGTIHIRAFHEGGQVTIEFIDDGRGVDLARVRERAVQRGLLSRDEAEILPDREVINLLFQPGFSTAEKITNLSGRGVGMDVVKTSTESIGGTIDIQSKAGEGTIVRLRLPLTLAIVPALVVICGKQRYAIPQVSLQEMVRLPSADMIESLYGGEVYRLRGELLPLLRLRNALGLDCKPPGDEVNIVVIRSDDLTFGLIVDDVLDTEEIVVKPLSKELKALNLYAGATIMGDGRIALILDVAGLASTSRLEVEEKRHFRQAKAAGQVEDHPGQSLLLFSLAEQRHAIPLSLVSRLEEIPNSSLEMVSGRPMVHYRNMLLPLLDLSYELGQGSSLESEMLQVLVFRNGDKTLGLAVDTILDVVEQDRPVQSVGGMHGLLGSTIIDDRAVALVDIQGIISGAIPDWLESEESGPRSRRLLIVGDQSLHTSFARSHLETQGHRVFAAENRNALSHYLENGEFDCVVFDLGMKEAADLFGFLKKGWPDLPVVGFNQGNASFDVPHNVLAVYGRTPGELSPQIETACSGLVMGGAA